MCTQKELENAFYSFKNLILSRATAANIHKLNNKLGAIQNSYELLYEYMEENNEKEIKELKTIIRKEMEVINKIIYKDYFIKGVSK